MDEAVLSPPVDLSLDMSSLSVRAPLLSPPHAAASPHALSHSPLHSSSSSSSSVAASKPLPPGRFKSFEFACYFLLLAWAHYRVTESLYRQSDVYNQPAATLPGLVQGWLPDRKRDARDLQYRFFRDQVALLSACLLAFVAASRAVQWATNGSVSARLWFSSLFSLAFLLFCHETGVLFMLAIVAANYAIGSALTGSVLCPALTWTFNALVLLLNERFSGYKYAELLGDQFAYLDAHKGVFGWHSLFNLVVLRMISFNLDRHWAVAAQPPPSSAAAAAAFHAHRSRCLDCLSRDGVACTGWREKQSHPLSSYSPLAYFGYLFYVPLHFAGPTISFNAFLSYLHAPSRLPASFLLQYAARLLFAFVLLDVVLHYLYVFALTHPAAFPSLSLVSLSGLVYWTLTSIWLKFLVIWRFFRLFALLDGVECVENMGRCVNNHHSVQEFWRDWHRAFNRWLLRYLYVPLGGNLQPAHSHSHSHSQLQSASAPTPAPAWRLLRRVVNVFVVFSWVAYWHDRTMQLLAWGWLVALLFVPQLAASAMVGRTRLASSPHYRHVHSAGAALNILLMMLANLVGYSVGVNGTLDIVRVLADAPLAYWAAMASCFFAAAQIQLELRRREKAQKAQLAAQLGLALTAGSAADGKGSGSNGWKEAGNALD